ncbi:MAG: ribonuclease D [Rhodobacteraceae bacterium]|nr:ribonuclease D [Paracoccaceae bacterium]
MRTLTTTDALAAFCDECASQPYVTVDTEFLRERTYYAQLCLVQVAMPGEGTEGAVLIDTLAEGIDLAPLYDLFRNENVVKVFHAARQDLEIFAVEGNVIPKPFFDTQVAAMVCGFGEQVGYETLVRKIARQQVDKSSRFTDWSRRPLSDNQKTYAIGDVTHLRVVYEELARQLKETGREAWVEEELAVLMNPDTYIVKPENAWKRLKTRTSSQRFLAVARELANFREAYAQEKNIPRPRIYKDDALLELAANKPKNLHDLGKSRLLRDGRRGEIAEGILAAVKRGVECPQEDLPEITPQREKKQGSEALSDLLRVLLKAKSSGAGVAAKLIATAADLDRIASEDAPDVAALKGWRHEVFGADALLLKDGKVALSATPDGVKIVPI